uniref:Uncharacterized protein n=1 Tax=Lotharella globosa TaxID=91324 RepID=A0A7S4DSY2_9EUKA
MRQMSSMYTLGAPCQLFLRVLPIPACMHVIVSLRRRDAPLLELGSGLGCIVAYIRSQRHLLVLAARSPAASCDLADGLVHDAKLLYDVRFSCRELDEVPLGHGRSG